MVKVLIFFILMKFVVFFGVGYYGDIFNNQCKMENEKKEIEVN